MLPPCSNTDQLVEYVSTGAYIINYIALGQLENNSFKYPRSSQIVMTWMNISVQTQDFLLYYWHIYLHSVGLLFLHCSPVLPMHIFVKIWRLYPPFLCYRQLVVH